MIGEILTIAVFIERFSFGVANLIAIFVWIFEIISQIGYRIVKNHFLNFVNWFARAKTIFKNDSTDPKNRLVLTSRKGE